MTIVAMSSADEAILGDLDRDDMVGFQDFFLLADNFGKRGPVEAISDTVFLLRGQPETELSPLPIEFSGQGYQMSDAYTLAADTLYLIDITVPEQEFLKIDLWDLPPVIHDKWGFKCIILKSDKDLGHITAGFSVENTGVNRYADQQGRNDSSEGPR